MSIPSSQLPIPSFQTDRIERREWRLDGTIPVSYRDGSVGHPSRFRYLADERAVPKRTRFDIRARRRGIEPSEDMAFLLARKLKMAQRYDGDEVVPVTILEALPCTVTQVRTTERDGYAAVQVGAGARKRVTKPMVGHLKNLGMFRCLREFRSSRETQATSHKPDGSSWSVGDRIDISAFRPGDRIQVTATSKGKGFQGVMKRHHFHGQDATHGTKHAHREPGSIGGGGRYGKGRVVKGMRMAGRMGGDRVTVQGLSVAAVDAERGVLEVKGAVPGARGALVAVQTYESHWALR